MFYPKLFPPYQLLSMVASNYCINFLQLDFCNNIYNWDALNQSNYRTLLNFELFFVVPEYDDYKFFPNIFHLFLHNSLKHNHREPINPTSAYHQKQIERPDSRTSRKPSSCDDIGNLVESHFANFGACPH